jgi:hypothetical protein
LKNFSSGARFEGIASTSETELQGPAEVLQSVQPDNDANKSRTVNHQRKTNGEAVAKARDSSRVLPLRHKVFGFDLVARFDVKG